MSATVKVSFDYEPDEPDDEDNSGMSEEEFERVMDACMAIGGTDIRIVRQS